MQTTKYKSSKVGIESHKNNGRIERIIRTLREDI